MSMPSVFKNMNIFIDGIGYQGKAEELVPPKLAMKTEDYSGGGMGGPVELHMGLEKLEMELTFAGFMPDLAKKFGAVGVAGTPFRLRGAFENDSTLEWDQVEISVRGRLKELDLGTWKRHEKAPFKTKVALAYYKLTLNDETLIEIDLPGLKFVVDGRDRYEGMRQALGV